MRANSLIVASLRKHFKDLIFTSDILTEIQAFAQDLNAKFGEPLFMFANEWPRGQWFGNLPLCRASAILADLNEPEGVLVTGALMSHGYGYNGGQSRSLTEGYTELLPAIVSSLCMREEAFSIPWFFRDGGMGRSRSNSTIRALSPKLSNEKRMALLGSGDEAWGTGTVQEYLFFPVAKELGLDLSGFNTRRVHEALESFEYTLNALMDDPDDSEEQEILGEAYLAYLVTKFSGDLQASSFGDVSGDGSATYSWLQDWRPWQMITEAVWPPTLEMLQETNEANSS